MNLKYYLRGLGIGLIVTTIILTISNNVGSASNKNSGVGSQVPQEPTSGSVIAFDRQTTTESTTEAPKEEESTTEPSTEAVTQPAEQETTTAAQQVTSEAATQQTTQEVTRATTQAAATSVSDGNEVRVVIKDVYYGTQAADILYDAGLITDKNEFVQYLISTGYGTKIQEGVYSIPKDSSYEAICQAISRK